MTKAKKEKQTKYTQADLEELLVKDRGKIVVKCRMLSGLAGGMKADDKGLRAFIQHHMNIDPDTEEFEATLKRIKDEELGEKDETPEGGELDTKSVYAVNVIRRNEKGPFIMSHMIQAMIKQSASRLGIFVKKRGSKGDITEMGMIRAHGDSLKDEKRPYDIYLLQDGKPVETRFEIKSGCVSTPSGKMSIMTHVEVAPEGTEFEYELSWHNAKMTEADVLRTIAGTTIIGQGSCLSLGHGVFEVVSAELV